MRNHQRAFRLSLLAVPVAAIVLVACSSSSDASSSAPSASDGGDAGTSAADAQDPADAGIDSAVAAPACLLPATTYDVALSPLSTSTGCTGDIQLKVKVQYDAAFGATYATNDSSTVVGPAWPSGPDVCKPSIGIEFYADSSAAAPYLTLVGQLYMATTKATGNVQGTVAQTSETCAMSMIWTPSATGI